MPPAVEAVATAADVSIADGATATTAHVRVLGVLGRPVPNGSASLGSPPPWEAACVGAGGGRAHVRELISGALRRSFERAQLA
jgi:hypothetical protein